MKYRDYLILPVLMMFVIYASCAYVGQPEPAMADETPAVVVSVADEREELLSQLTSGKFVNERNARDYFVLKANGKSVQYCGDRVFKGKWDLSGQEALTLRPNRGKPSVTMEFLYDGYGSISGVICNEVVYSLSTT